MGPRTSGISLSPTPGDTSISGMAQAEGSPYSTHTPKTQSNFPTVDTLLRDTTATLKQTTMDLAVKVLVIEERNTFLGFSLTSCYHNTCNDKKTPEDSRTAS